MVTDACRDWRNEIAATAAGRPDPLRAQGSRCPSRGLPALPRGAGRADAGRAAHCSSSIPIVSPILRRPPEGLGRSVVSAVKEVRRSDARAARWRRAAIAATAVAGAAAVVAGVLALSTRTDGPDAQIVAFATAPDGVVASVELSEAAWGTQIALDVDGLADETDDVYWLWLSAVRRRPCRGGNVPRRRAHADVGSSPSRRRRSRVGDRCLRRRSCSTLPVD